MLQSMRSASKWIMVVLFGCFVLGFLLFDSSGLMGRAPVTTTTAVATVNGEDILYTTWQNAVQVLEQQQQQQIGRGLTLDERRTLEDQAFDQLVTEVLLEQEYKRRGITVTDDEIRQAALLAPPPEAMQAPDLQTDGQFDIQKYRRLIESPSARQSGMLVGLEQYYRTEIPKQKLFDQVSSDVYVTDSRLWSVFRDRNDSVQVSFVALGTQLLTDTAVTVTDAEISRFYEANKARYERPARAVVSLLTVPRVVTAADSAAARARAEALRAEIVGGAKFEDVARRESSDSLSGPQGGSLGKSVIDRYTPKFAEAVRSLPIGQVSEPVLTPFGWHILKVESRQADTADVRHILVGIAQSDSSATRTDRRADSLNARAGSQQDPKKFDEAAKLLGLTPSSAVVLDKEPLTFAGKYIPSVSAWAFSGVQVGETSDLFDAPDAYYLARVDSLQEGGQQSLAEVRDDIRRGLARDKRLEKLRPVAQEFATNARTAGLEAAAAQRGLSVQKSDRFSRSDMVPGLGQFNEAIGAAFALPVGGVSAPMKANDALAVLRVDDKVEASREAFNAQKAQLRQSFVQQLRQARVQEFLRNLRESVNVEDNRGKVNAALRRQTPA